MKFKKNSRVVLAVMESEQKYVHSVMVEEEYVKIL
jgi:hypothetical protein